MDRHGLEPATLRDVLVDELMDEVFALRLPGGRGQLFLGHFVTLLLCFFSLEILTKKG